MVRNQYMAQSGSANAYQSNVVQQRWNQTVGDELINKDMEQL
ncbi:hypothetical protein [Puia dinghuensis]|uniref:Uncharacterized protein n=1 Tax=Puia dinghuensis TaxID=1792502 RepID=A0A8J2UF22_9BACT|nr:hypothetical protein [Puia dinghuensis]GGB08983.1 hypothetical protein GCM10011511_35650 [Puia dinghuensis]